MHLRGLVAGCFTTATASVSLDYGVTCYFSLSLVMVMMRPLSSSFLRFSSWQFVVSAAEKWLNICVLLVACSSLASALVCVFSFPFGCVSRPCMAVVVMVVVLLALCRSVGSSVLGSLSVRMMRIMDAEVETHWS
jgi:hypothetical protein